MIWLTKKGSQRWQRGKSSLLKRVISVLIAVQMPISFAQSPTLDPSTLNLNPVQQKNLGDYIRSCEIEKEISMARFDSIVECSNRVEPEYLSTNSLIVLGLSFMSGVVAGVTLR